MRRAFTIVAIALACLSLAAAQNLVGNGVIRTQARSLRGFSGLDMDGAGILRLARGPSYSVTITLDANLLSSYRSEVKDGVLHLGFDGVASVSTVTKLVVEVTLPELSSVLLSGACEATTTKGFSGERLSLKLSGSSSIIADVDFASLDLEATGSSKTRLSGGAKTVTAILTGASELDGSRLQSTKAQFQLTGASNSSLRVQSELEVNASGASSFTYWGSPSLTVRTSGAATVNKG